MIFKTEYGTKKFNGGNGSGVCHFAHILKKTNNPESRGKIT